VFKRWENQNGKFGGLSWAHLLKLSLPPGLRLGGALLQFFATVLIARTLGDEGSGEFFFWAAILMSLGRVATFGLDKISLRQVPRLVGAEREVLATFLANVRGIAVALALVIGFLLSLYALFIQSDIDRPRVWYFLLPACIAGVALCRINGEAIKGMGRPMLGVVYRHVAATGIFLILLLVASSKLTPEVALICYTVGFCVAGFGALRGPGFSGLGIGIRCPEMGELRNKLLLGLPIFASSLFSALNYIVPLGILEHWHSSADVAYLTTSYRLFMLFEVLALAVYAITMPQLSRASHEHNWPLTAKLYRGLIRNGLLILGLPVVVAFVAAAPLMELFGGSFSEAVPVFRVLLIFRLVALCLGPAEDLLIMVGHTGKLATFAVIKLILTLIAAPFVVTAYGPIGMACLIGFGILLQNGLCRWQFHRIRKQQSS
tara:strand:+ start:1318 stop:2613 length:1296 start_codon:yes stop_codon:yes gene_type:complete